MFVGVEQDGRKLDRRDVVCWAGARTGESNGDVENIQEAV
jgi:hypothetical protein